MYNWLIWKVDFREERERKLIWIISATSLVFTLFSVAWRRSPTHTSAAFAKETSSSTSTAGSSLSWTNLRCIPCNVSYFLSKLMVFLCQVAVSLFQAGANIVTLGILKASDRPHDIIAFAQGQTPFGWDHYSYCLHICHISDGARFDPTISGEKIQIFIFNRNMVGVYWES